MFSEQMNTNLPDIGQPVVTITDPDWITLGELPGLQTWLDASQLAGQTAPNYFDIMGSDIWSKLSGTIGPALNTTSTAFGTRPSMDFRASAGGNAASPNAISIGANNQGVTASCAAFMPIYLDASNPTTGFQYLLRYFNSGTSLGASFTIRNGGLGFSANFTADGNGAVYTANNAIPTSGANGRTHIVGFDYDDTTKTVSLFIDSPTPIVTGQVTTAAAPTSSSRWSIGAGSGVPQILVAEAHIYNMSIIKNPAMLQLIFQRMKARSAMS